MIKQMISYLTNNPQVTQLVRNGQASLVGVTPVQQRTIVDTMSGGQLPGTENVRKTYWYYN
ncbi:hypothetical protein BVG16_19770 [Paenibacillus selenitireducens]|jgi:hypothetical protein|uniref:ComX pheromone n=1 Tax=Paenibacillus selenitireducens TaxID=1324314 RepID=A0A1T2X7M0_9BACL|nr:competence pheromone ComX [Paenibacillus selenitireducens]OPA75583.1 hypothetical protein BVG16_19770 [Paenibacillus selenitireducens]